VANANPSPSEGGEKGCDTPGTVFFFFSLEKKRGERRGKKKKPPFPPHYSLFCQFLVVTHHPLANGTSKGEGGPSGENLCPLRYPAKASFVKYINIVIIWDSSDSWAGGEGVKRLFSFSPLSLPL